MKQPDSQLAEALAAELQLNLYVCRMEGERATMKIPARSTAQAARIFARLSESRDRDICVWPEIEWGNGATPFNYPTTG